ncbi:MAG: hypothetical protein EA398_07640 [Deltaproteobacteria bacterium]|nr:MAG: hypothetical protein EA398_07640 [Deltaproteobacteria bacterium]
MTHPTGRALDAVAAISPFGSGTPTGVPSEFRIANQEQERVADLAEAFEADVDQAATTAPTSAGRAHFRTSRDTSADDDEFVQPVLTSRNALGSGGSDSNGPMLTPRKGIPEDLINLTRGPRMFGEEPRRAMDSREDLEDLFKEFLASYRRAGRQAPLIDFPSFERRIRDQQVRLLKEDPRARIEVFIRQEEGRPRICFRKLA